MTYTGEFYRPLNFGEHYCVHCNAIFTLDGNEDSLVTRIEDYDDADAGCMRYFYAKCQNCGNEIVMKVLSY